MMKFLFIALIVIVCLSLKVVSQSLDGYDPKFQTNVYVTPVNIPANALNTVYSMALDHTETRLYTVGINEIKVRNLHDGSGVRSIGGSGITGDVQDLVVDASGNVYVAYRQFITKIPASADSTAVIIAGVQGYDDTIESCSDGVGDAATFCFIGGIALSQDGKNLFVNDQWGNKVRKINLETQKVTTIAVLNSNFLNFDNYNYKFSVVVDKNNHNLYVSAESGLYSVSLGPRLRGTYVRLVPSGGISDGKVSNSKVKNPERLSIDDKNNVYVGDHWFGDVSEDDYILSHPYHVIRRVTASGLVSSVAGGLQVYPSPSGSHVGDGANFGGLLDLQVTKAGNAIYVLGYKRIVKVGCVDGYTMTYGKCIQLSV